MKKGLTLLELLIALAIASIVSALVSSFYLKYNSLYNENSRYNRNYYYTSEALMFIQNEIRNSKNVSASNNVIEVKYPDGITKKTIKYNGAGNLTIAHYKSGTYLATNNILTNVNNFSVFQKYNTIYVSITINDGERYERCFGINLEQ
ncbi:prepilin-type N-terminal cleavage/methylation domain-containing protein [Candidatus Clostridium radicumherbarum]|uniref:Prepilin-type N-terminal cleavage/methylation domain-containing protein n=1 Tax=Candidatus Clostridium radicumherbarum TaxID=3381662 RepID=A0ABW8TTT5_9CLOT